jgi:hypothetical protein
MPFLSVFSIAGQLSIEGDETKHFKPSEKENASRMPHKMWLRAISLGARNSQN